MTDKSRVLFVCHGNICRSPLAEGVFRKLVHDAGLSDRFEIDSAGVSGYHAGEAPDPRTCAEAAGRGLVLNHSARKLNAADFGRYDHILVMDSSNYADVDALRSGASAATIELLRAYDPLARTDRDVPDPYYGGPRGFADVHDMIERACAGLLEALRPRD